MPATATNTPLFVSRQINWPDGEHIVEIAVGGLDYANPGMLVPRYAGEGEEYLDPREALFNALALAKEWQTDEPDQEIGVGAGCTGGFTLPFSDDLPEFKAWREFDWRDYLRTEEWKDLSRNDFPFEQLEGLIGWALDRYEQLELCARCSDPIGTDRYTHDRADHDRSFCSEHCAEEDYRKLVQEEEQEDEEA